MDMTTNVVLLPMMRSVCPSCSISMMILSPPVWLTCLVVACGSLRLSAYLSVLLRVSLSFSSSPCYFVPQSLCLSEAEEVQCNSLAFAINYPP